MQMCIGAVEEGIARAEHGDVLAAVEPRGECRGGVVVEFGKGGAVIGVGLGQLGGEGIIKADEFGSRDEVTIEEVTPFPPSSPAPDQGEK